MDLIQQRAIQPILVVEDSDEDYEATVRAFRKLQVDHRLIRCVDGDAAFRFLYHHTAQHDTDQPDQPSRPAIILLDLNLPGMDGRDVLRQIKTDANLKGIPVIILTTSNNPLDIQACYQEGANTYVQKPLNLEQFYHMISVLYAYWFDVTALPGV